MVPVATPFIAMKNLVNSPMKTSLFHTILQVKFTDYYYKLSGYRFLVRFQFSRQNSVGWVSAKSCFFVKSQCSLLDFCHLTNFLSRWRIWSIPESFVTTLSFLLWKLPCFDVKSSFCFFWSLYPPYFKKVPKSYHLLLMLFWKHCFYAIVLEVALSIERISCSFAKPF